MNIFEWIAQFGYANAPLYDWRFHLDGYDFFNDKTRKVIAISENSPSNLPIHSKTDISITLELNSINDVLYGRHDLLADMEYIGNDFQTTPVKIQKKEFASWLAHLLAPGARKDIDLLPHDVIQLFSDPIRVYFLPCLSLNEFREFIATCANETCLLLFCLHKAINRQSVDDELSRFENIRSMQIGDLIAIHGAGAKATYSYKWEADFMEHLGIVHQQAGTIRHSLFPRPSGCTYNHMYMVIHSEDKESSGCIGQNEQIEVFYKDEQGHRIPNYHTFWPVDQIKNFTKTEKKKKVRAVPYQTLRRIAQKCHDGKVYIGGDSTFSTNLSRLRSLLQELLGYTQNEDPFPNPTRNSPHIEVAFSLTFASKDALDLGGNVVYDDNRGVTPSNARKKQR